VTNFANCTTSWDDGHPADQHIAELLAKYGLTGTFYVPIENSRPVMTPRQIRELGESFEVGAHTTHHVVLTDVSEAFAQNEICESKKRLEDIVGTPCETFCFPKGRFSRYHLDLVRRAGFRFARTVELLSTQFPARRAGIGLIPTTVQARCHHWTAYAKNCAKRLSFKSLANLVLHARSRDWPETACSMLQVVARQGGVFHLWGHSWEIEEQQQWPQLECVLREMQALKSTAPCVPNSRLGFLCRQQAVQV
jgi:peptidoglycan/xylan/chitin deacetylase (PgdA/CDA1 family)